MAIAAAIFKVGGEVMGLVQSIDIEEKSFEAQQDLAKEKNYFKGGLMYEKKMLKNSIAAVRELVSVVKKLEPSLAKKGSKRLVRSTRPRRGQATTRRRTRR